MGNVLVAAAKSNWFTLGHPTLLFCAGPHCNVETLLLGLDSAIATDQCTSMVQDELCKDGSLQGSGGLGAVGDGHIYNGWKSQLNWLSYSTSISVSSALTASPSVVLCSPCSAALSSAGSYSSMRVVSLINTVNSPITSPKSHIGFAGRCRKYSS